MAKLIDGKAISAQIRSEIKTETEVFAAKYGKRPGLAVIIVGSDPASQVYVRNKRRACEEVGFYSEAYELPEETTQEELNALVTSSTQMKTFTESSASFPCLSILTRMALFSE